MTLTLREMSEIITGRKNAALMETKMPDGRENPLSVEYNEGVKMMSKYMADYFLNEFDMAQNEAFMKVGGW
jgi:hypothetical protein